MAMVLHEKILLCQFFSDQAFSVKMTTQMACFCVFIDVVYSCQSIKHNLERISLIRYLTILTSCFKSVTCTHAQEVEQGGQGDLQRRAPIHFCDEKDVDLFDNTCDTGDFREHIFCPQTTQGLPKKHHESGLPEQLPTDALSQIDYWHTIHCEGCKEVCLCKRTTQRAFWKICVGVCTWLSGTKASHV